MKLTQLKYFQAICKYNNITHAAHELHISQPSLSHVIKELEEEFGISLFQRRSKGLSLTKEGKILLEETDKLLEQANHLISRMNTVTQKSQHIKLGISPMLASLIFPELLHSYHLSFPKTQLEVSEHGTLTNKSKILNGSLDVAIISCDGSLPPSYQYCDLLALDICFYTSVSNPIAARSFVTLEDCAHVPLVLLTEDTFLTDYLFRYYKTLHLTPNVVVHTNQIATIHQLIHKNTASSFLFDQTIAEDHDIVKLPVKGQSSVQVKLIWKANRQLSSATQNLIRFVRKKYP